MSMFYKPLEVLERIAAPPTLITGHRREGGVSGGAGGGWVKGGWEAGGGVWLREGEEEGRCWLGGEGLRRPAKPGITSDR